MAGLPHDNYGPQLAVVSWLLVFFSAVFLFLRILLKVNHKRGLWWDDYLLVASWLILTAGVILNFIDVVDYSYGKHTWDVSPHDLSEIIVNGTVSGTLFLIGACWSKTSFAFTLLRLPIGWMRYLVWFIIITLNLSMHLSALSIWIECPMMPTPGHSSLCIPVPIAVEFGIIVGGYSAAADFILALLPWKFLWNLQMQQREKIGVLIAMSMGAFAGLSAIIKTTRLTTLEDPDIIDSVQLAAWAGAEVGVTIMAASIPILRALFRPRAGMPDMRYGGASGVTPARRRGAAAAAAAAAAVGTAVAGPTEDEDSADLKGGSSMKQLSISTAPQRPESKRWPLLTPKSARYPGGGGVGGGSGDLADAKKLGGDYGVSPDYDDDDEDYEDLKKPPPPKASTSRSFFRSKS